MHHCDRFLLWLETKDVPSHHSTVVLAMAEKANMVYPGEKAGNTFIVKRGGTNSRRLWFEFLVVHSSSCEE